VKLADAIRLLITMLMLLLSVNGLACGKTGQPPHSPSTGATSGSTHHSPAGTFPHYLNDGDNDPSGDADNDSSADNDNDYAEDRRASDNTSYHESDDRPIMAYGHDANPLDARRVATVVKHYYAAARNDNGARACSILSLDIVKSLAQEYGQEPGPAYLRGQKTCSGIMAHMFDHFRDRLRSTIVVTSVRIAANQAFALLGSTKTSASYISLQREEGCWRVAMLIGSMLP